MRLSYLFIVALLQIELVRCFFDPITLGIGGALSFGLYKYFNQCEDVECCNNDWIPIKTSVLAHEIRSKLHGQQIAGTIVLRAIEGYKHTSEPPKALAMSFHGLPGSGKNFLAKMIADQFLKKGTDSEYYHFFNGRSFAPRDNNISYYKNVIRDTIVKSLMLCERSMFVFDEVDMMPMGLLNVLVPFLDYTRRTGVTYKGEHVYVTTNKAVFIFLSNTGSNDIMKQMLKFWEAGKDRDAMKLSDFENLIAIGAFNEKGGFQKSDAISTSLIDYYVPFMPLEEKHVKLCMRDAFKYRVKPTKIMEDEVMAAITWGPEPHNIYSRSGCKKIEQKVISTVYQHLHGEI